jgi:hypothetical protein
MLWTSSLALSGFLCRRWFLRPVEIMSLDGDEAVTVFVDLLLIRL